MQAIQQFDSTFSKEEIAYITRTVADTAKALCGDRLKRVVLYGSYARGDYKDWSDVDIMLLIDGDAGTVHRMERAVADALSELNYRMNILLSVIAVPFARYEEYKTDLPFYANIDAEGVQIYAQ